MERRMLARTLGLAVLRSAALITLPLVGSVPGRARGQPSARSHQVSSGPADGYWLGASDGGIFNLGPGRRLLRLRLSSLVCRRSTCSSTTASILVALYDLN